MNTHYLHFHSARVKAVLGEEEFLIWRSSHKALLDGTKKTLRNKVRNQLASQVKHPTKAYLNYGSTEYRHTFGTLLSLCVYSDEEIARLMRNSSKVVAESYNAICPADKSLKGKLVWNSERDKPY